jgi:phosphate transport system protein
VALHFLREMDRINQQLIAVGDKVEEQVINAYETLSNLDVPAAQRVIRHDELVDSEEVQLEEECLKLLALYQPVAVDLRMIISMLKINIDLERIGDHAAHISRIAIRLAELPHIELPQSMHTIYQQSKLMLRKSLLAFVEADSTMAETVLRMDEEVDAMCKATMPGQIELIRGNPDEVEQRLMIITACRQLERIGDHAANIAEDVIYLLSGDIIRHGMVPRPSVRAT